MSRSTEQNARTRDEQIADLTNLFGEEGTFTFVDDRDAATKHILEAEARGAAEERAKNSGAIHVVFDGMPGPEMPRFVECENSEGFSVRAGEWKKRSDGLCELVIPRHLANIARLESRVKALEEAFEPLLSACETEMTGDVTADCSDDEGVSTSIADDGTIQDSPITFGMIRRARAALTREGGV